jgi:hypothetical protein
MPKFFLSLTPQGEHRLRVFENVVLWLIFERKKGEVQDEENNTMRRFIICTLHQI